MQQFSNEDKNIIIGRNAVKEAINAKRTIDTILVNKNTNYAMVSKILLLAKERGIVIKEVDNKKLQSISNSKNHQGIIAFASEKEYSTVNDIIKFCKNKNESPFIIIADSIEDPYNLGAIIRTAECSGAHGLIIPKRHSASITKAVCKASAGAVEYLRIARVTNISSTIDDLKKQGLWIYGADAKGENFTKLDLKGSVALVVGNEGKGISRIVKEKCDVLISLPLKGKIQSLNASVAAGVIMYEILKQRG